MGSERTRYLSLVSECRADPRGRGRLPGRPSAGPAILAGPSCQTCTHRILFDIAPYPVELQFLPNQVVVTFLLPERLPGETEYDIGALGRRTSHPRKKTAEAADYRAAAT